MYDDINGGKHLSNALFSLLKPLASRTRDPISRLTFAWGDICGPSLAQHIWPYMVEGPCLIVGVHHPQWREAAFQLRHPLARGARQYVPSIRYIRLDTFEAPPTSSREIKRKASPRPPPPDPRTAEIGDPALRGAFDALLAARRRAEDDDDPPR